MAIQTTYEEFEQRFKEIEKEGVERRRGRKIYTKLTLRSLRQNQKDFVGTMKAMVMNVQAGQALHM